MENIPWIILIYIVAISIISVAVCIYDKRQARLGRWRVKESFLFLLSLLGGAVAMLCTMKHIRHKTKHKRFMIGLPVIIVLQLGLTVFIALVLDKKIL